MRYSVKDAARLKPVEQDPNFEPEAYRTPYRRDYGRLIHSPVFRRLQGKTQLFPGRESDFFRNRLTHSLEVAQIAKALSIKLNHDLKSAGYKYRIDTDLVEFAGLAHDLGHPPFGHFGEQVLDEKMINYGGFEANAQTLRIVARTEKRHKVKNAGMWGIDGSGIDMRVGLNLAARSIASILKYDKQIPLRESKKKPRVKPIKGYYKTESDVVAFIKKKILNGKKHRGKFKTVECQIMDIADDIAYSTYDLEDSFKAEFIKPLDLLFLSDDVAKYVSNEAYHSTGVRLSKNDLMEKVRKIFFQEFEPPDGIEDIISKSPTKEVLTALHFGAMGFGKYISDTTAQGSYSRINFTSKLVGAAIRSVNITKIDKDNPAISIVELEHNKRIDVEILKQTVCASQILSPKLQVTAFRSREIVETIFDTLSRGKGHRLLPEDFRAIYEAIKGRANKRRVICDFIAGMTDRYALEFYGRLKSENPETIFKPI